MDTNIVADELPISDDEQAKSERFLSLLQVQELSPKEKDIASILATHDRPALPVPKPTDPVKKVVSAKDAVPPIPKSAPRPESDEEWVNHDDWHTNQRLYDDRCPYCRKNPRYKPVDKPSRFTIRADGGESVLPYYVDKWDKRFKSATINVRSTGKDIFLGSYTRKYLRNTSFMRIRYEKLLRGI